MDYGSHEGYSSKSKDKVDKTNSKINSTSDLHKFWKKEGTKQKSLKEEKSKALKGK